MASSPFLAFSLNSVIPAKAKDDKNLTFFTKCRISVVKNIVFWPPIVIFP
jgi:hypothetical protein